jgi:uncharacterized membrane protein
MEVTQLISLILDFLFSYYVLAFWKKKWWVWGSAAIAFGIANTLVVNFATYFLLPDQITANESISRIIVGFFWHPIVCVAVTYFRKRQIKKWEDESQQKLNEAERLG